MFYPETATFPPLQQLQLDESCLVKERERESERKESERASERERERAREAEKESERGMTTMTCKNKTCQTQASRCLRRTGVPHLQENAPPKDRTVGLCLGPYGGLRGCFSS